MTLAALVSKTYPSPEWAVFFEVSNTTGFGANRRADAVALGIWPSRGNTIVGFEFKRDRGDWLRELKNPAKAESIAAKCDVWWMVTDRDAIIKPEELPEGWGLYVSNEDQTKLKCVRQATPFPDRDKTVMQRTFAAAMLRKVTETTIPKAELQRLVEEGVERAQRFRDDGRELQSLRERVAGLEQAQARFKQVSGVDIRDWRGTENIAAAVHAVLDSDSSRRALERAQRSLEDSARQIGKALASWPAPVMPLSAAEGR